MRRPELKSKARHVKPEKSAAIALKSPFQCYRAIWNLSPKQRLLAWLRSLGGSQTGCAAAPCRRKRPASQALSKLAATPSNPATQ
jgi:hypothetical protein